MTTFKEQLYALAAADRVATVQTMLEVFSELGVIREAAAAAMYDPLIVGAHAAIRSQIAHEVGRFLLDQGVLEFEQEKSGAPMSIGMQPVVGLRGAVWVLMPAGQQSDVVLTDAPQAQQMGEVEAIPVEAKEDAALAAFTEYFVKNYPGPNTVIGNPNWHAPKIFRAAHRAIKEAGL